MIDEKDFTLAIDGDTFSPSPAGPKRRGGRPPKVALKARLTQLISSVGTIIFAFDQTCGKSILTQSEQIAEALENVAKENPSVRKSLEKMLQGGAWGGVIFAIAPVLFTILSHHGLLPFDVTKMMGQTIEQNGHHAADTAPVME